MSAKHLAITIFWTELHGALHKDGYALPETAPVNTADVIARNIGVVAEQMASVTKAAAAIRARYGDELPADLQQILDEIVTPPRESAQ